MRVILLAYLVRNLINIFYYILLARIILSFFPINNDFISQIRKIAFKITEPVLAPFRNLIPPVQAGAGYIDLSPIIALIIIRLVGDFVIKILISIGI